MSFTHEYIEQIAATGIRTAKTDLLKKFIAEDKTGLLAKTVKYALEPTLVFNVGKRSLDMAKANSKGVDGPRAALTEDDFGMLDKLVKRELNRTQGAVWVNHRLTELHPKEAAVLAGILDKDLRWGLGASTINGIWPGFITEFNVMLAEPFSKSQMTYPCRVEPKYDGMRVIALVDAGGVEFFTRSGKVVTSLSDELKRSCLALSDLIAEGVLTGGIMLDGEVMGESFKETMEKARRKTDTFEGAEYHVFDWLPKSEFIGLGRSTSIMPYRDRRAQLAKAYERWAALEASGGRMPTGVRLPPSYIASSEEEVMSFYDAFRDAGLEGAIVKSALGPYVGKRSGHWQKLKAEESEDLEIIGYEEGTGKYEGSLGALIVNRRGVQVNVGTGLTDADRTMFWSNRGLYLHKLVEVQFQEVTPDGSLRHPRFIRMRMDKSEW